MPTYDYKCKKCDTVFEMRHGFDETPPKTCRVKGCRGKLERMFSPPAIIFKGKGWHVTDYGRGNGGGNGRPGGNGSDDKDKATEKIEKATEKAAEKSEKTAEKASAAKKSD